MQAVPLWKIIVIVFSLLISLWLLTPTISFYSYDSYTRNSGETPELKQIEEKLASATAANKTELQEQYKEVQKNFRNTRNNSIRLGLDLQGGVRLVLDVDRAKVKEGLQNDKTKKENDIQTIMDTLLDSAAAVVENRVNAYGVAETSLVKQPPDRLVLEMPGASNPKEVENLVKLDSRLSFHLVPQTSELIRLIGDIDAVAPEDFEKLFHGLEAGSRLAAAAVEFPDDVNLVTKILARPQITAIIPNEFDFKWGGEEQPAGRLNFPHKFLYLINKKWELTGDKLENAGMYIDPMSNKPEVSLSFNSEGARIFRRVTRDHLHEHLAIVLNDQVYSAPQLITEIRDGRARITGINDFNEARQIAVVLRAGALPAPLQVSESRVIGPSLGQDSIRKGVWAGAVGAAIVLGFMIFYYSWAGVVADSAVVLNIFMLMAGMAFFKATLTVPGIAGIFLTIGMAVDANVLIYERMREEMGSKRAKTLPLLLDRSYNRAFSAIFDSNLTTLITALVLFQFGTGPIKGFAVTLSLGIIISMFTAIFVTRVMYDVMVARGLKNISVGKIRLFHGANFNFFKYPVFFLFGTFTLGLLGTFYFIFNWQNIKGIDFAGGTEIVVQFQDTMNVQTVRDGLMRQGIGDAVIQQILGGGAEKNEMLIRVREGKVANADELEAKVKQALPNSQFERLSSNAVSAKVGSELLLKGLNCVFFASIGILLYLAVRFEFRFALGAVVALFHDLFMCLACLALFGFEFDLTTIAAILTVLGYSVNDTIVVFDRIRENYKSALMDFKEVVNRSINETLSRTILTVSTVIFVVFIQFIWGGSVIHGFAFCLLIGVVSGTYSSIFIASPVLLWMGKQGPKTVEDKEKERPSRRPKMVTADGGM